MVQNFTIADHQVLVRLSGDMYVEDASALREKLLDYLSQGYNRFIFDMADVSYIDSSGLGVCVAIQKRALQSGGGVMMRNLKGIVKELFELTRLNKVFEIQ